MDLESSVGPRRAASILSMPRRMLFCSVFAWRSTPVRIANGPYRSVAIYGIALETFNVLIIAVSSCCLGHTDCR
jgi:hypothetical protein